jgi:mono/diheme cytochrome c family protein
MRVGAARGFSLIALVLLTPCGPRPAGQPGAPSSDQSAEPSAAIDSDIGATRRPAASGGAPVSSPAAGAPNLGIGVPPAILGSPFVTGLPPGSVPAGVAFARRAGNPSSGLAFAMNNCRPCHLVTARQGSAVRFANAPDFSAIAQKKETTPYSLNVWLTNPHPTMPTVTLTPKEAANVIAYIMSLRR